VLFCGGTGSVVLARQYFGDTKEHKRRTKEFVCADPRTRKSAKGFTVKAAERLSYRPITNNISALHAFVKDIITSIFY
jgi:hypothetical protein